jgi:hypothetical protein
MVRQSTAQAKKDSEGKRIGRWEKENGRRASFIVFHTALCDDPLTETRGFQFCGVLFTVDY